MKVALITYEFFPNYGGIAFTLTSLCKSFQEKNDILYTFNPYYEGKNIFKVLDIEPYNIKDLFSLLINPKQFLCFIQSTWKILFDNKTSLSNRIKMVLYLLIKPDILIKTIKNILNILPHLKKFDIDIIFGGSSDGYTLPLIFILSRILNRKVCSFAHGNEILIKKTFSLKTFYLRSLDKILVHTHQLKNLMIIIHNLDANKISIAATGLILKDFEVKESKGELRKLYDISKGDFIILSVGSHVSRKKFDLVIKAIKKIKDDYNYSNIKYYLIGEGPETTHLKSLVNELKLSNDVKFLGHLNKTERNRFYKLSDLFVMPSITEKTSIEGFGVVFLEANYFKLPVIGTRSGGVVEAIIDEETGLFVKSNDLNDLIEKIHIIFKDEKLKMKIGENGHKRVIKNFNWSVVVNDYLYAFNELLDKK